VIGPAEGSGSYMFGLQRPMLSFLRTMPWSTKQGFITAAGHLAGCGVASTLLPTLADLDRPEDLVSWPELMP